MLAWGSLFYLHTIICWSCHIALCQCVDRVTILNWTTVAAEHSHGVRTLLSHDLELKTLAAEHGPGVRTLLTHSESCVNLHNPSWHVTTISEGLFCPIFWRFILSYWLKVYFVQLSEGLFCPIVWRFILSNCLKVYFVQLSKGLFCPIVWRFILSNCLKVYFVQLSKGLFCPIV